MGYKQPNPYAMDDDTKPLSKNQIAKTRSGKQVFTDLGLPAPRGRPKLENPKTRVTIRLDKEVVETLKKDGRGWQTRANAALRKSLGL